jgi:copper(I)-binding protein
MTPLRLILTLVTFLTLPWGAVAHDIRVADLVIDHPWARASAGQAANGVVYFAVTNTGAEADRLIGVETGVADRAELHANEVDAAGVMTMRRIDGVDIPPGGPVGFVPGGLHVMLFGLHGRLIAETTFFATLVFERAGRVSVEVQVQGAGAIAPSHGPGS